MANQSLNNLWQAAKNYRFPLLAITFVLVTAVTLLSSHDSGSHNLITEGRKTHSSDTFEFPKVHNPTVEIVNGTEIIWEIPTNPKAMLFVAHGCDGTPRNFWVRCANCPKCVGLPEETQIALDALARKYAVLVVSSTDSCWTYGDEKLRVHGIIRWWVEKNGLEKLPLVGLGASSGGYFLSTLATEVKFRGIVLMIASGLYDKMHEIPPYYPPTLFVHMPKDVERAKKVDTHIGLLKKVGVDVGEIKCMEIPITPNWLADRIPGLDQTTSSEVFKGLRDKGFIDANGYMKNDGRVTYWREAVKENNFVLPDPDESPLTKYIQEELNLAYGFHEMTSLQSKEIFEWFDSHIK